MFENGAFLMEKTMPVKTNNTHSGQPLDCKGLRITANSKHVVGAADSFETLSRNERGKRALFRARRNPDPSPAYNTLNIVHMAAFIK